MEIYDSFFFDNHGRYFSNCMNFRGESLKIQNSTFINNTAIFDSEIVKLFLSKLTGLPDIAELNPEIGGILYFEGVSLFINRSCFIGGTGFKGGAIYITSNTMDLKQNVLIFESYFKKNRGNVGGAINFSVNLKMIDAIINFCLFISNLGKSIFFFSFL